MRQDWSDYGAAADKGPLAFALKFIFGVMVIGFILWGLSLVCFGANETVAVVNQQYGPRAAVVKYEWFKDAATQLDRKKRDIENFQQASTSACSGAVTRQDKEDCRLARTELLGLQSSYNDLAAQYNANMSKVNWQFASASLPREIAPYTNGK